MKKNKIQLIFIFIIILAFSLVIIDSTITSKSKDVKDISKTDSIYSFQVYTIKDSNFLKIIQKVTEYFDKTKNLKSDINFCGVLFFSEENKMDYLTIEIYNNSYLNYAIFDTNLFIYNGYNFYFENDSLFDLLLIKTNSSIQKRGLILNENDVGIFDPYFFRFKYKKSFTLDSFYIENNAIWDSIYLK